MEFKMTQNLKQIFYIFLLFTMNINIKVIHCQEASGNCSCGNSTLRQNTGRIFMGDEAAYGEFPWHVALVLHNSTMGPIVPTYFCGGSIINEFYILTAAHCFFDVNLTTGQIAHDHTNGRVGIFAGTRFVYRTGQMPQEERGTYKYRRIQEVMLHPQYYPPNRYYDIAVAKLLQPVSPFDFQTQPICLPQNDGSTYENTDALFSGFGRVHAAASVFFSNLLLKTEVNIQPNQYCLAINQPNLFNPDTMLCAYNPDKNACTVDSGSPLVIVGSDFLYYQLGVLSLASTCTAEWVYCHPRFFTRVTFFRAWIMGIAGNTQGCQRP